MDWLLIKITAKVPRSWASAPILLASSLLSLADNTRNWPYDVFGLTPSITTRSLITSYHCSRFFTHQCVCLCSMEGKRTKDNLPFLFSVLSLLYIYIFHLKIESTVMCTPVMKNSWLLLGMEPDNSCPENQYWHNVHKSFFSWNENSERKLSLRMLRKKDTLIWMAQYLEVRYWRCTKIEGTEQTKGKMQEYVFLIIQ
jgi:hypothetical protein